MIFQFKFIFDINFALLLSEYQSDCSNISYDKTIVKSKYVNPSEGLRQHWQTARKKIDRKQRVYLGWTTTGINDRDDRSWLVAGLRSQSYNKSLQT